MNPAQKIKLLEITYEPTTLDDPFARYREALALIKSSPVIPWWRRVLGLTALPPVD